MTRLQMKVWTASGCTVERGAPDTQLDRHLLDKAAFARLADPEVSSVLVEVVEKEQHGNGRWR